MNRSSPLGGTLEDAEFEPGTAAVTAELLVQQPCFPSSFPALSLLPSFSNLSFFPF